MTAVCDDPAAEDAIEEDKNNLDAIIAAVGGGNTNKDMEE